MNLRFGTTRWIELMTSCLFQRCNGHDRQVFVLFAITTTDVVAELNRSRVGSMRR